MTKYRVINIFSLLLNLVIVGATTYGVIIGLHSIIAWPLDFTLVGAALAAISALILIPFNIIGIVKGKALPKSLVALKIVGAGTLLTSIVADVVWIGLIISGDPLLMFGGFSFTSYLFMLHFIVPVASLVSALFLDMATKVKWKNTLWALLPSIAYGGVYVLNIFLQFSEGTGVASFDSYGVFNIVNGQLVFTILILVGVALVSFLFATLVWAVNNAIAKAMNKDSQEDEYEEVDKDEIKPEPAIKEEDELVKEESAPIVKEEVKKEKAPKKAKEEKKAEPKKVEEEKKPEPKKEEKKAEKAKKPAKAKEKEEKPVAKKENKPAKKEVKKEAPKKEKAPVKKEKSAKKEAPKKAKEEPKKAAPKAKKIETKKPEPKKAKAPAKETPTKVYHLTKRKDGWRRWAITFVGGSKAVKLFRTKKEAEDALKVLTENQGATALIKNSKGAKAGKFASSIKAEK